MVRSFGQPREEEPEPAAMPAIPVALVPLWDDGALAAWGAALKRVAKAALSEAVAGALAEFGEAAAGALTELREVLPERRVPAAVELDITDSVVRDGMATFDGGGETTEGR